MSFANSFIGLLGFIIVLIIKKVVRHSKSTDPRAGLPGFKS